ncbi:hypothetical protein HGRIS_013904 [Hohenbuehelia grisea]|uniref:Peptidase M3A/M3B catalytic domain-containing protein n=1 Tax=Hohenbuehelia grisea TaxID=104357 RepID=A0ABR3IX04_9AGAR
MTGTSFVPRLRDVGRWAGVLVVVGLPLSVARESTFASIAYASVAPPQPAPSWNHTGEDIIRIARETIAEDKKSVDEVGALAPRDCNFTSVFLRLAHIEARTSAITGPLTFYHNVSPSKQVRKASNKIGTLLGEYGVEQDMRMDLFEAKLNAEKNMKASGEFEKLTPEDKRLVEKMLLEDKRAGLALPEQSRANLVKLRKELTQISLDFNNNLNEENGVVSFTQEQLKGVPKDVVSGYKNRTDGSKHICDVTFKSPDIVPILKFAEIPDTRRRAMEALEERLSINVPLLEKAFSLRRKIAQTLGYNNWADYRTETKMIKSAKGVFDFLNDLESKLHPIGLKERAKLLHMKEIEHKAKGLPFDGQLYQSDYRYYDRKYVEKSLRLDDSLVKEYFPVSVVVPAILEIYQNLLSVRFERIKDASTWHPDVQLFALWKNDSSEDSSFLGYVYLDIFPRDFKYSHAAVWPLISGHTKPDGTRSYPVGAMVANLAKPVPGKPALMRHREVVTFFHEMGHVFHGLLSKTKYSRFHGTSVARDFVEAPSQMLENWCWEPKIIQKISSHYKTKEPLPAELIDKVVKSRHVNIGLFYLRQVFLAKFDIMVHTDKETTDLTKLWNKMLDKISLFKVQKYTPSQAAFGHLMSGYDAGYYGYTYSLVFAADMYDTIFKADPLDPARGARYARTILQPGGSRDELESLKEFLGRPPNNQAFVKELFGESRTEQHST